MALRENVAGNVRAIRLARGMRQKDVAELTDLPRSYITQLEKGDVNITVETIERIAVALEVNPLILLIEGAWRRSDRNQ